MKAPTASQPSTDLVHEAVRMALAEDLDERGDITAALVPGSLSARTTLTARQAGVLAGRACAQETFRQVDPAIDARWLCADGDALEPGTVVAEVSGPLRSVLTAERTALNFLCHLSGVASLTRSYVDAVHGVNPQVEVLDTRKTTPGLRALEKAAVRAGGGVNHRASLSDAVLVKDNHLAGTSIAEAVARARALWPDVVVEIECDSVDQVGQAAGAGADIVLLDNMTIEDVRRSVQLVHGSHPGVLLEVSGGVTLARAGELAATGVDRISVGALTHSAPVLDMGLDLKEN